MSRKALTAAATVLGCAGTILAPQAFAPAAAADQDNYVAFLSPSRNISCELDYQRGSQIPDETFCQTNSPPQSVHMSTSGVLNTCTGMSCLGNAAQGTPTLAYG
ncbi:MAG: hypothetical protein ACXVX7_06340, partial [Mycobacterium sp.]